MKEPTAIFCARFLHLLPTSRPSLLPPFVLCSLFLSRIVLFCSDLLLFYLQPLALICPLSSVYAPCSKASFIQSVYKRKDSLKNYKTGFVCLPFYSVSMAFARFNTLRILFLEIIQTYCIYKISWYKIRIVCKM